MNTNPNSSLDKSNMFGTISDFASHIQDAYNRFLSTLDHQINSETKVKDTLSGIKSNFSNIIIAGMGGSAIGGDLLRAFVAQSDNCQQMPIMIARSYSLPLFANSNTLVIVSSYSGDTEETVSVLEQAIAKSCKIICIAKSGKVAKLAKEYNLALFTLPEGFQPRAALAYSFTTLLAIFQEITSSNFDLSESLNQIVPFMQTQTSVYSNNNSQAFTIANQLSNKIPIVYTSNGLMEIVGLRWRAQIQENSKQIAFSSVLPEMNHNEINSFIHPANQIENIVVVCIRDISDHVQVAKRFDAIKNILTDLKINVIEVSSNHKNELARIFDMIHLGDWLSYHLAIVNNEDPTPIPLIIKLKNIMSGLE
jgi:glucose/mannose-6-phosphate isomerase